MWDNVEEIDFTQLPNEFILKWNHGSGNEFYSIINDKTNIQWELDKLRKVSKTNFAVCGCEYQYELIKPKIIAEKLLKGNNKILNDYKVLCFNGIPKYILVCTERNNGRDYFDFEWNYMPFVKKEYRSKNSIEKPQGLDKMYKYASIISKGFNYARVDFYDINGKIYFGEITLTPSGCCHHNLTKEAQIKLGNLIELPRREE